MQQWETVERNAFAVFLRDISQGVNINLRHMIEDMDKPVKDNGEKKKVKKKKKKDIIIEAQEEKRRVKLLEDENKMVNYMVEHVNHENIYENLKKLKIGESKLYYKCELMKLFRKRMKKKDIEYNDDLFNLYFDLSNNYEKLAEGDRIVIDKLKKTLDKYNTKSYMLEYLGHLMPPLNVWDKPKIKLDNWQVNVIRMIRDNKSILVRAPTSSGKTFIAMSAGILHKRVLYVCPAKPVAYQVGANYVKMGYKVHFLVDNCDNMKYDASTNIFVGIPDKIEEYLPKLVATVNFDYVVYDEIHMAGESREYENIIKMLRVPYLALSATIGNIEGLKETLERYNNINTEYIEYNKRFINQQRWVYDKNMRLKKLHPCSCYDNKVKESMKNISFTPYDCYDIYNKLEDYEEMEELEPEEYSKEDRMITLDEVRGYEVKIKEKIDILNDKYPEKIDKIMNKYKNIEVNEGGINNTLLDLLFECKSKDLLPALYFQVNEENAKEIFKYLYRELEYREEDLYPYHYKILERKDKEYNESQDRLEVYKSSIKVKTKDVRTEIESKLEDYKRKEIINYRCKIGEYYETCITKCEKEYQRINLRGELKEFLNYPDYRRQDIYQKHHEMCFTKGEPMSGNDIKIIRRELRESVGINICYTSELFQLLKRGIGIYIESMPDKYNWIVQKLMSEKKLGVVITDRTLCLGIDLPIRTTILSGYKDSKYTLNDYLQMSGRAGRRGHDNRGNIIFHGVNNYKELMKNTYPEIRFANKKYNNYSIIKSSNINTILIQGIKLEEFENKKYNKLVWILRYYDSYEWIRELKAYEIEIFENHKDNIESYMLKKMEVLMAIDVLRDYNDNNIRNIKNIKNVGELSRKMYNILDDNEHMLVRRGLLKIFEKCRLLIYRNQLELGS